MGLVISCSSLASAVMPVIMALPALLPVVCHLETNTIWPFEEGRRVVAGVLWIQSRFGRGNSERSKLICYGMNIGRGIDTQAEMMQARRVRVMQREFPRRSQHEAEVSIEVLNVRVTRDN